MGGGAQIPIFQQDCAKTPGSPGVLTMAAQQPPLIPGRPWCGAVRNSPYASPSLVRAPRQPLTMLAPTLFSPAPYALPSSPLELMPAGISCSPPRGEFGVQMGGCDKGLNPNENRVRNQTGSEGLAEGTLLRQREPPGAQAPQSGLYEQPAHIVHTAGIPACRGGSGGGGRHGAEGGKQVNHLPPPSLTPSLPDSFIAPFSPNPSSP